MANIKKLFEQGQGNKLLTNSSVADVGDPIESADFVKSRVKQAKTFVPNVNFATASNFAFYGLAEEYYKNSFDYITNEYPYDGSNKEKIDWELSGTYLDKYIFDKVYPRTNGFVNIGYDYGSVVDQDGIFSASANTEYIKFYSGPNQASGYDSTKSISEYFSGSNAYSTGSKQDTNIDIDGTQGFSVEFWLKKDGWSSTDESTGQVILDIWNSSSVSAARGQFTIYADRNNPDRLYCSITSGSSVNTNISLGTSLPITDGNWNHYALTFKNEGSSLKSKLYLNSKLNDTDTTIDSIGRITGSVFGYIGALTREVFSLSDGGAEGRGKLSGSLDDFRIWKSARTEKDIKQNWFTNVNGGSNSDYELAVSSSKKFDLSNPVDLGVYFKFNEGIINTTASNSQDAVVLDYAGRSSNGAWTGYSVGARQTGSAMVLSTAAKSEFKDPIIYASHPNVSSLRDDYINQGKLYDSQNNSALYWSLPSWIINEDQSKSNSALRSLTQIMSSQFDKLQLQMSAIKDVKGRSYENIVSGGAPPPFMSQVLRSYGLENDEILSNATELEYLASRNETSNFEEKLNNTKNLIYTNLYNNLVDIYKSKGTEKAFRNLIRCFGVDESIVNLNLYGSNVDHELKENEKYSVVRKKGINFFHPDRFEGRVFQNINVSPTPADQKNTLGLDSDISKNLGTTFECNVIFNPNPPKEIEGSFSSDFLSSSVFGCHKTNYHLAPSTDYSNFQIYSVRKNLKRSEAFFVLTGTTGAVIPELTSSVFKDVYEGSKWNLSLRFYPEDPFIGTVSGSASTNYIIRFTGFQYVLDDLVNSFDVSSSLSNADGKLFYQTNKRLFVGSHRERFTTSAAVLEKTNAEILNCRVWSQKIENEHLKVHAKDPFNFGVKSPGGATTLPSAIGTSTYGTELGLAQNDIPEIKTLILNWDFETVTGSNALGRFEVLDYSSGSASPNYGFMDSIIKKHPGLGHGVPANSTDFVSRNFINSSIQKKPEVVNSSNMVSIVSETDDELFTKSTRPIDYYFSFEKSMYNVISQDMLNMFATIIDFNNIIGEPVYRYRPEYKNLEKLRHLYFENVNKDLDFEKFLEYYKWIDSSISTMLMQLAPASANFLDGMKNMVESHVLERNKYWTKFPTLDSNQPADIEGTALGRISQNTLSAITKPDEPPCGGDLISLISPTGVRVQLCSTDPNAKRLYVNYIRFLGYVRSSPVVIQGGSNTPNSQKEYDYFTNQLKLGESTELKIEAKNLTKENFNNFINETNEKDQVNFAVEDSSVAGGYGIQPGKKIAPFSLYSSSVESGYITQIRDNFKPDDKTFAETTTASIEITNYHDDSYARSGIPMQGPFSQEHVGGKQYRHQGIVTTVQSDGDLRAEGWNLDVSGNNIQVTSRGYQQARATLLRNTYAKRPVNIRNIKYNSGSSVIGNYERDYEIFQTSGRTFNNRNYVKSEGQIPTNASSSYVKNIFDYEIPRYDLTGSNKSIIVERFSAPGGPETNGGGLNIYGAEYSIYNTLNYRNLAVRTALNSWYTEHAEQFGIKSGSSISADNYIVPGAFHKTNRNPRHVVKEGNDCAIIYDNWWIQHAIPQSIYQNNWVTASVSKSACDTLGEITPFTQPTGSSSVTQSVPFIVQSTVNASNIHVDFVGLNTLINDPVNSDLNLLSSSNNDYKNTDIATLADGEVLNSLLLHRNGPFQNSSWKQIRAGHGPLTRYQKKNNIVSTYPAPTVVNLKNGEGPGRDAQFLNKRPDTFKNFIEPPVSFKSKPLITTVSDEKNNQTQLINDYSVNKQYFSQPIGDSGSISDYIGFKEPDVEQIYDDISNTSNLNLVENHYGEIIYPRDARTGLAQTRTRVNYAETATVINGSASFSTGSNGVDRGPLLRRSFWRNSDSLRNRRISFDTTAFSYHTTGGLYSGYYPNIKTTLPNSQGYYDGASTNIVGFGRTPLSFIDTAIGYEAGSSDESDYRYVGQSLAPTGNLSGLSLGSDYLKGLYPDTGELNSANWQTIAGYMGISSGSGVDGTWANQTTFYPTASAYYYHRSKTVGINATGSLNKLAWRVAELSGKNPWFDSYEDYTQDISKLAQDFTIVPEFKISDHMDYYSEFNFRKNNDKFLILHGANITASAIIEEQSDGTRSFNQQFFNEYSNTDFQDYFGKFSQDLNLGRVSLTCNGVKKLLPYMGFYPSQRTLQLASLFSQSLGPHISGLGWSDGKAISSSYENSGALAVQSMLQPYYAPGILYNTIKSGIACDWGAYTSSFNDPEILLTSGYGISLEKSSNYRVPFESILDPLGEVGIPTNTGSVINNVLNLLYPSYTSTTQGNNSTPRAFTTARQPFAHMTEEARIQAASSGKYNLYRLGINNFLSEVSSFFLEEQKLKSIKSKRQDEISLVSGTAYYMDVTIEKDKNITMLDDFFNEPNNGQSTRITQYRTYNGRFFGPPVNGSPPINELINPVCTGFYDPLGEFGYTKHPENAGDPFYAQYTPPYFYGKSIATVKYVADSEDEKGNFSFKKLFEKSSVQYKNPGLKKQSLRMQKRSVLVPWTGSNSASGSFQCSASFTYAGDFFVLSKSAGTSNFNFGAESQISQPVSSGSFFEWQSLSDGKEMMVGLNDDPPASVNYTDMNHAIQIAPGNVLKIWESGTKVFDQNISNAHTPGDWYRIRIDDNGTVNYEQCKLTSKGDQFYPNGNTKVGDNDADNINGVGVEAINKYGDPNAWQAIYVSSGSLLTGTLFPDVSMKDVGSAIAYAQVSTGSQTFPAEEGAMSVNSSLNLFGIFTEKQSRFNENGDLLEVVDDPNENRNRWIISPKMETPVLDFSSQPRVSGFGRGMWSGYGQLLTSSNGVTFGIEETFKSGVSAGSGSLVQKCFDTPQLRKVGEIADIKKISEAIVAIPYSPNSYGRGSKYAETTPVLDRNFFRIKTRTFDFYKKWYEANKNGNLSSIPVDEEGNRKPSESITKMMSIAGDYVLPPELDFMTYDSGRTRINPFAMYIFEFNHYLDAQDLADIWQGVMPKISTTPEFSDPTVDNNVFSHKTGKDEFFHGKQLPPDTRWMVFKVKKRAGYNYFEITPTNSDDEQFNLAFSLGKDKKLKYSFNWPYDFFSLVELAQVQTENTFATSEDQIEEDDN